ncbi:hypothetical protein [Bacillus thuringiensis]|uniref:hypothetical protein n=1 Tax=Bacillus thuringiensis TaxID=1428 RepID=UPI001145C2B1|nr:hypothetical protein [Bacillus thuringiensis]
MRATQTITKLAIKKLLEVGEYDVNRYVKGLEDGGYVFNKKENGRRMYKDEDVLYITLVHRAVQNGEQVGVAGKRIVQEKNGVKVDTEQLGKYKAQEVAKKLGIPVYTVTNLTKLSEQAGHTFHRYRNLRMYSNEDVNLFQTMLQREKHGVRFTESASSMNKEDNVNKSVYRLREFAKQLSIDKYDLRILIDMIERKGYVVPKAENGLCQYGKAEYELVSYILYLMNKKGYSMAKAIQFALNVAKRKGLKSA